MTMVSSPRGFYVHSREAVRRRFHGNERIWDSLSSLSHPQRPVAVSKTGRQSATCCSMIDGNSSARYFRFLRFLGVFSPCALISFHCRPLWKSFERLPVIAIRDVLGRRVPDDGRTTVIRLIRFVPNRKFLTQAHERTLA